MILVLNELKMLFCSRLTLQVFVSYTATFAVTLLCPMSIFQLVKVTMQAFAVLYCVSLGSSRCF